MSIGGITGNGLPWDLYTSSMPSSLQEPNETPTQGASEGKSADLGPVAPMGGRLDCAGGIAKSDGKPFFPNDF